MEVRRGLTFTTELLFIAILLTSISIYAIAVTSRDKAPDPGVIAYHVDSLEEAVVNVFGSVNDPTVACSLLRDTLQMYDTLNILVNITYTNGPVDNIVCTIRVDNVNEATWAGERRITIPASDGGIYIIHVEVEGR